MADQEGIDYADLQGLIKALAEKASCAVCGENEWLAARAEHLELPLIHEGAEAEVRLPVLPAICKTCGHVRLFSIPQLQTIAAGFKGQLSEGNGHL